MEFINYPTILLGLLLFVLLHIGSAITKGILSKLLNYLNLGLHIVFLIPMMTLGISIEEAVLVYMVSVFVYTLMQFVVYRLHGAPAAENAVDLKVPDAATSVNEKGQSTEAKTEEKTETVAESASVSKKKLLRKNGVRENTLEDEVRIREARGITADASPIRTGTPIEQEYEPIRIEPKADGGEDNGGGDGK